MFHQYHLYKDFKNLSLFCTLYTFLLLTKATERKQWSTNMKDIWNLQSRTRIVVDVNQYGQLIGKEASKLDEFLDTVARIDSIYPLNSKHYKHLSKYMLENLLRIVHVCST